MVFIGIDLHRKRSQVAGQLTVNLMTAIEHDSRDLALDDCPHLYRIPT